MDWDAKEVLQTPMTMAAGVCEGGTTWVGGDWGGSWEVQQEEWRSAEWAASTWGHDALLTMEDGDKALTDNVLLRCRATAQEGHTVVLILAGDRHWKELRKEWGAETVMTLS